MYPPVRSCGEKDLQDNGRRDLDKEICSRLDDYYPDWKDPKGTHMVPRSFISKAKNSDLGEITEKDFFDILKEFGEIKNEPMFVIHSYKFSEYIPMWQSGKTSSTKMSNWVMGEHDFVIVHHVHGVVFLQVKATKTSGESWDNNQKASRQNIRQIPSVCGIAKYSARSVTWCTGPCTLSRGLYQCTNIF